jgi:lysophospholipase L1-like esterase
MSSTLHTNPSLLLNVKVSEGGSARVAVLDETGKSLPGFDLSDCDPHTGDQVRGIARWRGKADLSAFKGKTVRLKLELTKCSLYSFRFSAEAPIRVVCLGDSVTRAVRPGVNREQTFCGQLESHLRASGRDAIVINSGVGSDTTSGGLARFDRDVLAHNPTHVCIMFGLNDAYRPKPDAPPLVGLAQYSANLREMIAQLRSRGITPLVMTSNPFLVREKNVALKSYVEAARQVARDEDVALIDLFARFAELAIEGNQWPQVYADGDCHLNLEGNTVIAKLMMSSLESLWNEKRR